MINSTGIPWLDRLIRTLLQLAVSGMATTAVNTLAGGLSDNSKAIVLTLWMVIVTTAHNILEDDGKVPTILKGSSEAEFAQQLGLKQP